LLLKILMKIVNYFVWEKNQPEHAVEVILMESLLTICPGTIYLDPTILLSHFYLNINQILN
jgi:hypothetical protein